MKASTLKRAFAALAPSCLLLFLLPHRASSQSISISGACTTTLLGVTSPLTPDEMDDFAVAWQDTFNDIWMSLPGLYQLSVVSVSSCAGGVCTTSNDGTCSSCPPGDLPPDGFRRMLRDADGNGDGHREMFKLIVTEPSSNFEGWLQLTEDLTIALKSTGLPAFLTLTGVQIQCDSMSNMFQYDAATGTTSHTGGTATGMGGTGGGGTMGGF